jgi:hypothetical protein
MPFAARLRFDAVMSIVVRALFLTPQRAAASRQLRTASGPQARTAASQCPFLDNASWPTA